MHHNTKPLHIVVTRLDGYKESHREWVAVNLHKRDQIIFQEKEAVRVILRRVAGQQQHQMRVILN